MEEKENIIENNYRKMGIAGCHPINHDYSNIKELTGSLDFMGVTGSKWISNGGKDKIEKLLESGTSFRFLLINPYSRKYSEICERKRKEYDPGWFLQNFQDIIRTSERFGKSNKFEIRCYNHSPLFRLQIENNDILYVSPYDDVEAKKSDEANKSDKERVCLKIESHNNYTTMQDSLFMTLYTLFEKEWQDAIPLHKIIDNPDAWEDEKNG